MKNIKKMTSIIMLTSTIISLVSCDTDVFHKTGNLSVEPSIAETTAPYSEESSEYQEPVDITGTEIVWLSDYDLNPQDNAERSVAVSLFEDVFGGKIKYVQTSSRNRFTDLSSMLLAGEEVDMFEYVQEDFPKGVLSQQYQPLDEYFDSMGMNTDLWDDMIQVIDSLKYDDKHYVIPYSLSNPVVMTYSRKIIEDNGLQDPYELYKNNKWNWDSFLEISESYKEKTGNYAVRGNLGESIINSTGKNIIGYKNGSLVSNINTPQIRTAELFMQDIYSKSLYSSYWNDYYTTDTLFFVYNSWILGVSNVKNPDMDLMIVPVPKFSDTDDDYIKCQFNAKMLVANSDKGDAVATYIKCERIASTQEEYKKSAKEYALTPETSSDGTVKSYITEEQYDVLQSIIDTSKYTPVFEYAEGMGDTMKYMLDDIYNMFLINEGSEEDWKILRNSSTEKINEIIKEYK